MPKRILDEDLVRVWGPRKDHWSGKTKTGVIDLLFWGDEIDIIDLAEVDDTSKKEVRVRVHSYYAQKTVEGVIRKKRKKKKYVPLRFRQGRGKHLLEALFVDVQQGDATLVRTPDRQLILVDGGEQKFVARLLASLFPKTTASKPLDLDALVITHGDADHFSGLLEVLSASRHRDHRELHVRIRNYFHNGLVKGPSSKKVNGKTKSVPDKELFGAFRKVGKVNYATDLWDDPRDAAKKNGPFRRWCDALNGSIEAKRIKVRRLEYGDDRAFDAFRPGVDIQVLGPVTEQVGGKSALPFFASSASHTINGHSVVLRLKYGNVSFMLGGDLNHYAQERLREHVEHDPTRTLRSEILKVPHHGSHEFEQEFLDQIDPVVSVISSGDENVIKEYVHPRANLMAALGRASRGPLPLVFSTELAAFFAYRGAVQPEEHETVSGSLRDLPKSKRRPSFHAFQRLVWGAVRVRTDGSRVLVAVESANANVKEAYAFHVDPGGGVTLDDFTLV